MEAIAIGTKVQIKNSDRVVTGKTGTVVGYVERLDCWDIKFDTPASDASDGLYVPTTGAAQYLKVIR